MTEHPNAERIRRARTREWLIAAALSMLVGVPCLLACFTGRSMARSESARPTSCLSNVRQVGVSLLSYADRHDGCLPPGRSWCDGAAPLLHNPSLFLCPSRKCERSGYWMNALIAGTDTRPIANPDRLVVTFEGEDGWNRVGGPADQVTPHNGGANLGFMDGHAKWFGPKSQPPEWALALPRPKEMPSPATGAARL